MKNLAQLNNETLRLRYDKYRQIYAHKIRDSFIELHIAELDEEIKLFDLSIDKIMLRVDGSRLIKYQNSENKPKLFLNRGYVIRYHNNNGRDGILDASFVQRWNTNSEVLDTIYYQVRGTTILELPFMLNLYPNL
jgi:hypothetical protein